MEPYEELIQSLRHKIVEAALTGQFPIDVVLQSENCSLVSQSIAAVEGIIDTLLLKEGFVRCRAENSPISGVPELFPKWVYFRPSEGLLQQAINNSHPIVLATTAEPQRYLEQLVHTPLWIWRGGSNREILESTDTKRRSMDRFSTSWMSQLAQLRMLGLSDPKSSFASRGANESRIMIEGKTVQYWWRPADDDPSAIDILVDDVEVESLNKDTTEQQIEVAIREAVSSDRFLLPDWGQTYKTSGFSDVLAMATRMRAGTVIVIPDAQHFLHYEAGSPTGNNALLAIGALKETYHRLITMNLKVKLVLLSSELILPKDLREEVLRIDLPLPNRDELFLAIRKVADQGMSDSRVLQLAEEMAGMTIGETRSLMYCATGLHATDDFLVELRRSKKRHISRSPALELIQISSNLKMGGMENFERWLQVRRRAFHDRGLARRIGIDRAPRGVLLLGIPGSGKSLGAKLVSKEWNLPLIRLDVGALSEKWYGASEARLKESLKVIEAMAPCVLWIDEIDKGTSQETRANSADQNLRASLLTWMQENQHPVFIVATANKFAALPPELVRAGRFDARFFFGCPGEKSRERIFEIHLESRGYKGKEFNLSILSKLTNGFTGAEIEQIVLDALYMAFYQMDSEAKLVNSEVLQKLIEFRSREIKPIISFAGKGLEEVWDLIDQGRIELASDDMLKRKGVAQIIEPNLFSSLYCRLEKIVGFDREYAIAERLCMAAPFGGATLAVQSVGENWIYVQTNFKLDSEDGGTFKFLEKFEKLAGNLILDHLIVNHGLQSLYFDSKELKERFEDNPSLSEYASLFKLAD